MEPGNPPASPPAPLKKTIIVKGGRQSLPSPRAPAVLPADSAPSSNLVSPSNPPALLASFLDPAEAEEINQREEKVSLPVNISTTARPQSLAKENSETAENDQIPPQLVRAPSHSPSRRDSLDSTRPPTLRQLSNLSSVDGPRTGRRPSDSKDFVLEDFNKSRKSSLIVNKAPPSQSDSDDNGGDAAEAERQRRKAELRANMRLRSSIAEVAGVSASRTPLKRGSTSNNLFELKGGEDQRGSPKAAKGFQRTQTNRNFDFMRNMSGIQSKNGGGADSDSDSDSDGDVIRPSPNGKTRPPKRTKSRPGSKPVSRSPSRTTTGTKVDKNLPQPSVIELAAAALASSEAAKAGDSKSSSLSIKPGENAKTTGDSAGARNSLNSLSNGIDGPAATNGPSGSANGEENSVDPLPSGEFLSSEAFESPAFANPRRSIFRQVDSKIIMESPTSDDNDENSSYSMAVPAAGFMVISVNGIFKRLRFYTDLSFFLAIIGLFLSLLQRELYYHYGEDYIFSITILRGFVSFFTFSLIYSLYKYYQADFQFLQLNRVFLLQSSFWNTQMIYSFLIECLVNIIHEPPGIDWDYDISIQDVASDSRFTIGKIRNWWGLLMILRCYLVLRVVLSRYYTGGTKILGMWFNFAFNAPFAIRNLLYSHPLKSMLPVALALMLSASYSMWVCERTVPEREFTFGTAVWVVAITISAVGYGDAFPVTQCGRGVSVASAFIGIVVTAVSVAAVHQSLALLPYEHRMVEFLERNTNAHSLQDKAARCIAHFWFYHRARRQILHRRQEIHRQRFLKNQRKNDGKIPPFTMNSHQNPSSSSSSPSPSSLLNSSSPPFSTPLIPLNYTDRLWLLHSHERLLQSLFDFQNERKKAQAYDRRYHTDQLFRFMLENLHDKLEAVSVDLQVVEEDIEYSIEQMKGVERAVVGGKRNSNWPVDEGAGVHEIIEETGEEPMSPGGAAEHKEQSPLLRQKSPDSAHPSETPDGISSPVVGSVVSPLESNGAPQRRTRPVPPPIVLPDPTLQNSPNGPAGASSSARLMRGSPSMIPADEDSDDPDEPMTARRLRARQKTSLGMARRSHTKTSAVRASTRIGQGNSLGGQPKEGGGFLSGLLSFKGGLGSGKNRGPPSATGPAPDSARDGLARMLSALGQESHGGKVKFGELDNDAHRLVYADTRPTGRAARGPGLSRNTSVEQFRGGQPGLSRRPTVNPGSLAYSNQGGSGSFSHPAGTSPGPLAPDQRLEMYNANESSSSVNQSDRRLSSIASGATSPSVFSRQPSLPSAVPTSASDVAPPSFTRRFSNPSIFGALLTPATPQGASQMDQLLTLLNAMNDRLGSLERAVHQQHLQHTPSAPGPHYGGFSRANSFMRMNSINGPEQRRSVTNLNNSSEASTPQSAMNNNNNATQNPQSSPAVQNTPGPGPSSRTAGSSETPPIQNSPANVTLAVPNSNQ